MARSDGKIRLRNPHPEGIVFADEYYEEPDDIYMGRPPDRYTRDSQDKFSFITTRKLGGTFRQICHEKGSIPSVELRKLMLRLIQEHKQQQEVTQ
jgi:hypothetical protein